MKLTFVVTVYNEVKSLSHVLLAWSQYLIKKKIRHEFVICEDGSTDGTKKLISKLKKNIQFQINQ